MIHCRMKIQWEMLTVIMMMKNLLHEFVLKEKLRELMSREVDSDKNEDEKSYLMLDE